MDFLDDATLLALSKHLNAETKRRGISLDAGEYPIDRVVKFRVEGVVRKNEQESYIPTIKVSPKAVVALALEKAGFMREHIESIFFESMKEIIEMQKSGNEAFAKRLKEFEKYYAECERILCSLPEDLREGKTFVEIDVEEV